MALARGATFGSRRIVAHVGSIAAVGALVGLVACSAFSFPTQECHGELIDWASPQTFADRSSCAQCLELHCCDDVGFCSADQTCAGEFRRAHQCVQGNPAAEIACVSSLPEQPRKLYGCMRDACANECAVPSCVIAPTVSQLGEPTCDRCITASCCEKVNVCYENRRCKLTLECIVRECKTELGVGMTELANLAPGMLDRVTKQICSNDDVVDNVGQFEGCIQTCLQRFTTGTSNDPQARCEAFEIYACAAQKNCAGDCQAGIVDGGADAASDAPSDAGAD